MDKIEDRMLIYALKYALGRSSTAVDDVIDAILKKDLTTELKLVIISEIEYFLKLVEHEDLSTFYKVNEWKDLLKCLRGETNV
jgi:hypothetical protein